jgi:hypothetical protein
MAGIVFTHFRECGLTQIKGLVGRTGDNHSSLLKTENTP